MVSGGGCLVVGFLVGQFRLQVGGHWIASWKQRKTGCIGVPTVQRPRQTTAVACCLTTRYSLAMKRIAILTAGGDTPALNATIYGAVARANACRIEVIGLLRGFSSLYDKRVPHVRLNPLFGPIPELDPTKGGTLLGSSRTYVDASDEAAIQLIGKRLEQLRIDGLICVGGDGTLNGMQPLADRVPTVLSPKTIDNDLGLNYPEEPQKWHRKRDSTQSSGYRYETREASIHRPEDFHLTEMINYVTPGYATSVFVSAGGVQRIRTTAESHRRIAIIEVMGRHSGYIAMGSAYGQPDMILVPESPIHLDKLVDRVQEIYTLQGNVVIVCGEGIVDEHGQELGAAHQSTDPAGNVLLSGAAEHLRRRLVDAIDDSFFRQSRRHHSAESAIFTRKVGHTQRGGRPLLFDRFHAVQLGGKCVDMLLEGQNNAISTLQATSDQGFQLGSHQANEFRDQYGVIHARKLHSSFYDAERMNIAPTGIDYLLPIFTAAIGADDTEAVRQSLFDSGNLYRRYHSVNIDIVKRTEYLQP